MSHFYLTQKLKVEGTNNSQFSVSYGIYFLNFVFLA